MARKVAYITIQDTQHNSNRDNGKIFIITEMPAMQAAHWADRVLLLVARSNLDLPKASQRGMAGIAEVGLATLPHVTHTEISPMMDELLRCVRIQDGPRPDITRELIPSTDIEEIGTVYKLRFEVLKLHIGFFLPDSPSISASASQAPLSSNIPTSTQQSVPLSRQARRRLKA